jgi:NTE family protein
VSVAFALSGGANLGPMQAGAVAGLLEADIVPDLLVGSSVGSLNAAFLACRPGRQGVSALREAWIRLRRRDAFRFNFLRAFFGFLGMEDHLVAVDRMRALIRQWIPIERIEDAPLPFAVVVTDALSGEPVVLDQGDPAPALLASAAIPGIFPPVRIGDRWFVDGSLSAGCPVLQAQDLGADVVYRIATGTAPRLRPPRGAVAMAMHSVALLTGKASADHLALARARAAANGGQVIVVPAAQPTAPGPFDFRRSGELFDAAYRHTVTWLSTRGAGPAYGSEETASPICSTPDRTADVGGNGAGIPPVDGPRTPGRPTERKG